MSLPSVISIFSSLAGSFGGKKSGGNSAPRESRQEVAKPDPGVAPTVTPTQRQQQGVAARKGRADQLVSGRPGNTTRSGVNIPA